MSKRILILSGGGAKGYAQAQVLKKFERDNGILYNFYDLICGSSVGAINGAMLASGKITMDRMESIYPEMVMKIFKRQWFPPVPMYDRKNFISIWNDEIGMMKMSNCKTKLQITSVSLCDKRNRFFKSWETEDGKEFLVSVVCRSFAAPLYFGTLIDESSQQVYFDGGMGVANMPIVYGLVEAFLLWPDNNWHFDIIGCGYSNQNIPFNVAKKFQFVRQLSQYFDLKDGGLAREQVRQEQINALEIVCKSSKKVTMRYYDIEIPQKMDTLDGIKYLNDYKKFGEQMAKNPIIVQ